MLTAPVRWIDQWPITYPCRTGPWTVTDGDSWGTVDPESGTSIVVDPADDPKLAELPNALNQGQLLSYRHHRRAVIRTDHGYTKIIPPKKTEAIAQRHQLASELGLRCPRVARYRASGRIDLHQVPGTSLHQHLVDQRHHKDKLVATAHAIADLHQHQPVDLPVHRPSPNWIETTARADPALAKELQRTFDLLPPSPNGARRLVHTDLHDKNILLDDNQATLIDLDGLALGDPAIDLGNLTAHLTLRALQGHCTHQQAQQLSDLFLTNYSARHDVDMDAVLIAQRHTWLRLAALYHFRRASQHLVPSLIRLSANGPSCP